MTSDPVVDNSEDGETVRLPDHVAAAALVALEEEEDRTIAAQDVPHLEYAETLPQI